MSTCAERGVMCEGDLEECQQARRCLLSPAKKPDPPADEVLGAYVFREQPLGRGSGHPAPIDHHARAIDPGWETV